MSNLIHIDLLLLHVCLSHVVLMIFDLSMMPIQSLLHYSFNFRFIIVNDKLVSLVVAMIEKSLYWSL